MGPPQQDARVTAREIHPENAAQIARDLTVALITSTPNLFYAPSTVGVAYTTILDYIVNGEPPAAEKNVHSRASEERATA